MGNKNNTIQDNIFIFDSHLNKMCCEFWFIKKLSMSATILIIFLHYDHYSVRFSIINRLFKYLLYTFYTNNIFKIKKKEIEREREKSVH